MFKVNVDREIPKRFKILQEKIQKLSCMFQNTSDVEISIEDICDWNILSKEIKSELNSLIKECSNRIKEQN